MQGERGTVEPPQLDLTRDDVQWRPRMPAIRAAIVTEMPDVRGRIVVRRAAAQAVLRVGGVLQCRPGTPWIVEPEHARPRMGAREVAHLRVVAVDDELRVGEPGDRRAPAARDELELAVAVELVA